MSAECQHAADVLHSYELFKTINTDLLSDHSNVNDEPVDDIEVDDDGDNLDADIQDVESV